MGTVLPLAISSREDWHGADAGSVRVRTDSDAARQASFSIDSRSTGTQTGHPSATLVSVG
jgi:hypothetical protein